MKTKPDETVSAHASGLRPVPMGLFPTMESCQSVIDMAISQLPVNSPNAIVGLLMTYHNTLLQEIKREQEAN